MFFGIHPLVMLDLMFGGMLIIMALMMVALGFAIWNLWKDGREGY